ncbi:formylglycine-generating enzyme family protein [Bernardetia sp. OM2101]|uniref:formylglycine-generating enzyme family protein n=1 Tax=Bernardetia sp. OM2101 TaxID=3344876 RepID=UPI0035D03F52
MKKLTQEEAKEIIDLIEQANISDAFDRLDKYAIHSSKLASLRNEYITGKDNHFFADRFKTYVKSLSKKKKNEDTNENEFVLKQNHNLTATLYLISKVFLVLIGISIVILMVVANYKENNDMLSFTEKLPKGIKLVKVESGQFLMGCDDKNNKECYEEEKPSHSVYLTGFYISQTEITNAQYAIFLNDYGSIEVKKGKYLGKKMFSDYYKEINKMANGK